MHGELYMQTTSLGNVFILSSLKVEWVGMANWLRIDPDKLHLVSTASGCDLQRQKTLGLLCWIEDEPRAATFDRLVAALVQVQATSLAGKNRFYP